MSETTASAPSSPRGDKKSPSSASRPTTPSRSSEASSTPSSPKKRISPASRPTTPAKSKGATSGPSKLGAGGQDILLFLIASRLLNALIIQTFFQPDEYFQALEPAWEWAFGKDSGAWMTWEWKHHLRSAIHPAIFAVAYRAASELSNALNLTPRTRTQLLIAAPKTVQAMIAAAGDYYTWKLGEQVYGTTSIATAATLILTVASPWQWFCSTRTFSNSLETTLTIIALYNWPWHWSVSGDSKGHFQVDGQGLRVRDADSPSKGEVDETTRVRRALLFAAIATILRPTNLLIWLALTFLTFTRRYKSHWLIKVPGTGYPAIVDLTAWRLAPDRAECLVFLREAAFCGSTTLAVSALIDRVFYGTWTFPPLSFLYFNVAQSIAVFYGNNNWHYYASQGYPLLLTTALPFAIIGLYNALIDPKKANKLSAASQRTLGHLAIVCLFVPAILSIISHKEVRFIYPLLPGLHILAAGPLSSFFAPAFDHSAPHNQRKVLFRRALLFILLWVNLTVSLYTTTVHNSGLIDITTYLRSEFQTYYQPQPAILATSSRNYIHPHNLTVSFLTPCHSTPHRSHLLYPPTLSTPGIDAWSLTCEPPLDLTSSQKDGYRDEADQFYIAPSIWLKRHMSRHPPLRSDGTRPYEPGVFAHRPRRMFEVENHEEEYLWRERGGRRAWPEYLVFFEQLEPTMRRVLGGNGNGNGNGDGDGHYGGYSECKRLFNSHWHDDWRRRGDMVVWCLYPERSEVVKRQREELGRRAREVQAMAEDSTVVERAVGSSFWKDGVQRVIGGGKKREERWWEKVPGLRRERKSWW